MPNAYTITTPSPAITVTRTVDALVVYTVKNVTERSIPTRATVTPFPPTPVEWFRVDGREERLFPPGGSEAFTVVVKVPADAPQGTYSFRLDARATDRPDDDWAFGSRVGFELGPVVGPPPPPPPGYVETLVGALLGSLIGSIGALITGFLVLVVGHGFPSGIFEAWFRLFTSSGFSAALALGGALGILAALVRQRIEVPPPWLTAVPYGILAWLLSTIVQVLIARAFPPFSSTVAFPVILLVTLVGLLAAAAISALAARGFSRFRALGTL